MLKGELMQQMDVKGRARATDTTVQDAEAVSLK
jgi:hypothetical protein